MMYRNYFLLFALFFAKIFFAQTELSRWNKNDLTSTPGSNVTAQNITTSTGVSVTPTTWSDTFFLISGLSSSATLDNSKYVQFQIAPNANYKLNLSNLNLTYRNQGGTSKLEIRYSVNADFSNPQTLLSTSVIDANWHTISPSFNNVLVGSGKSVYVRLYVYNTYNNFHLSYTANGGTGTGPNITGTASVDTPTVPTAYNDSYTAYKNNENDFNILNNDLSTSAIAGITITEQPAHGIVAVNGTTNVTYKPTVGYTGTDNFKYKTSNTTGLSNEATVSINVIENANTALVRWNNSNFSSSVYNTHVVSGNLTSTASLSYLENISASGYNAFHTTGWPDKNEQTIDKSKYIQFSISPKNGYKLNLSEFNFLCKTEGGDAKIKIDYSLNSDFTKSFNLLPETTVNNSISTISLTNFSKPIATDGQVVYLRIYVYNTWNAFQILLKNADTVGPTFIGNVEFSSTTPIAYNDDITNIVNNDIDINVLINDDYSNKITSLTFTQPSHGTASLNADRSINYIPERDFVGSDYFTYKITNEYGISNSATVSITTNANTTTPLVRWDQNNFTSTPFQSFISSTTMTTTGGMTLLVGGETNPKTYYLESSNNGNTINTSRYVQFILDNSSTGKTIEPKTFSFVGKGTNGATYEIRYSKNMDFSDSEVLATSTVNSNYTLNTFNFDSSLKVGPGEKVYLRLYFYNNNYVQYILQYLPGGSGPEISGIYYNHIFASNDTTWVNSKNPHWNNGLPTATKNAIIDTNYDTATYGNFETQNLTINNGGTLTINRGGYITVNGQIINNNTTAASFLVEYNANLLQNGSSQNIGYITVKKEAVIPKMGYNYWSSPVDGQNLYQFSDGYNQASTTGTGTPWNRFYIYNEANDNFVTSIVNDITLKSTSVFEAARGYAIRGKNSFPTTVTSASKPSEFQFVGTPQNGDISSFNLKWTDAKHGYNMIGNPYPSNISFDDFFVQNSSKMYGIAYFWTNNDGNINYQQGSNYSGNNYAICTSVGGTSATYFGYNNRKPNGNISVGQGFIIQAKEAGKNQPLVFKNSIRNADIANYYNKGGQKDRFWLEFKSPTDVNNEILIGYLQNATNDFDSDYDADQLAIGNDSFWSIVDNHKLAIQARDGNFNDDDNTRLGFKASASGNYTISLTDREGIFNTGQTIYIKDKYLSKSFNISEAPYTFYTNSGQYEDRFEIIYKPFVTLAADNTGKNGILIYKDNQNFIVKSDENIDEVSLYDSVGRLLYYTKNAKKEVLINKTTLAEGMYIIKAISRNTTITKKVLK
ncbi:Ig-like domain-containing protein [Epilithonimonas sp.]|uniref:Ig-like domain-containing protein n=1 Tax=Epilithonimonas sp. TaxID=2894511 RepID=UPI0028AE19AD|nr:Ig-like domain-containing protein [Epilithonimonas sp.]